MANIENKKIEEKEQESNVFIDEIGRLNIKGQEIYINEDGDTKEVDFRLTKPQNIQLYQKAYLDLVAKYDYLTFAGILLPKMIEKPVEARKVDFFEHDTEALIEISEAIVEYMGKSKEKKKRKLNMKLK